MWIQSSWEEKNNMTKFWWKLIVKSQEEIGEIYHILCNAREAKQRILFWQKKDANVKPKETKIESEKKMRIISLKGGNQEYFSSTTIDAICKLITSSSILF